MRIRTAQNEDLPFFVTSVEAEGWLGGTRAVFEGFLAHDPAGCLVAEENDERIGMIVATAYGSCGFLGELIVIPDRRGQGIGRLLLDHAIGYLQSKGCRSVYLDGDLPAVPLYERLGFRATTRSLRFLGATQGPPTISVCPMAVSDLSAVLKMDRAAFGADRSFFLSRKFDLFPDFAFVVRTDGEAVAGFIMGEPGHGVVIVGPWLTLDEAADPLDLLRALARSCGGRKLRVGVLESSAAAAALMRGLDPFEETEPCLRMVLGPDIGLGVSSRLLAIGSPAKG